MIIFHQPLITHISKAKVNSELPNIQSTFYNNRNAVIDVGNHLGMDKDQPNHLHWIFYTIQGSLYELKGLLWVADFARLGTH